MEWDKYSSDESSSDNEYDIKSQILKEAKEIIFLRKYSSFPITKKELKNIIKESDFDDAIIQKKLIEKIQNSNEEIKYNKKKKSFELNELKTDNEDDKTTISQNSNNELKYKEYNILKFDDFNQRKYFKYNIYENERESQIKNPRKISSNFNNCEIASKLFPGVFNYVYMNNSNCNEFGNYIKYNKYHRFNRYYSSS